MSSNFAEVMTILSQKRVRTGDLVSSSSYRTRSLPQELGTAKVISTPDYQRREEQGGNEEGRYVVHFPKFGVYLEVIGELDSYGSEETFPYIPREVTPKEKTITVYEYD